MSLKSHTKTIIFTLEFVDGSYRHTTDPQVVEITFCTEPGLVAIYQDGRLVKRF